MVSLDQRTRIVILAIYMGLLFGATKLALGSWYPPSTNEGLWFFAGLAALLLGNLLISPFFTKPADAVVYAASGLVAVLALNFLGQNEREPFERVLWVAVVTYMLVVICVSFAALMLKDATSPFSIELNSITHQMSARLGSPQPLYFSIFLFAVITFHRESGFEFGVLLATGLIVVLLQPLEVGFGYLLRLARIARGTQTLGLIGELRARNEPGIMLLTQRESLDLNQGDVVVARTYSDEFHLGILLDRLWLAGETWLRMVRLPGRVVNQGRIQELSTLVPVKGSAATIDPKSHLLDEFADSWLMKEREKIVGIVSQDTTLGMLVAEITSTDKGLEEGRLVQTRIGDKQVLFQVIDGISREEILQQQNTYGYARAKARKVGTWNFDSQRFEPAKWLPLVNEPVLLVDEEEDSFTIEAVGHFPSTSYSVRVDIGRLVTHNTAILGILGAGKTMLAFD